MASVMDCVTYVYLASQECDCISRYTLKLQKNVLDVYHLSIRRYHPVPEFNSFIVRQPSYYTHYYGQAILARQPAMN